MSVLIEAISVLIKRSAIDSKYSGGWSGFIKEAPNQTLCFDILLARVGFMSDDDAKSYVEGLVNKGFICFGGNDNETDYLAVVNQLYGFLTKCNWANFKHIDYENNPNQRVALCTHIDDANSVFCVPDQWSYEGSLSHTFILLPADRTDKSLKFLRRKGSTDVYLNELTGEEVFQGRII